MNPLRISAKIQFSYLSAVESACIWREFQTDISSRSQVFECSAAENTNIRDIFKSFLKLSKINEVAKDDSEVSFLSVSTSPPSTEKLEKNGGLRRNFSAYGRLKSQGKSPAVSRKEIFDALEEVNGHKKLGKRVIFQFEPHYFVVHFSRAICKMIRKKEHKNEPNWFKQIKDFF